MIFISAGHHLKDSGAVANGREENLLTIEFRDLVCDELSKANAPYIKDADFETLAEYLERIKTGNASVVIEFHFDAANGIASGSTSFYSDSATALNKTFCNEVIGLCSSLLGVRNRGAKSESESNRKRLALMREDGLVCLLELCFIDNLQDVKFYEAHKYTLAVAMATVLIKYDALI